MRSGIGSDIPLEEKSRLTLAEARELSARLRNAAKAGRDPAAERKKDRKAPPSFRERSEEHTSELQSLMRISYAVFCLKKKTKLTQHITTHYITTNTLTH